MKKIKVLSVFGTRPEAIKMCPLINKLNTNENFESVVCVTGQHREMLDEVLSVFNVKPDYDLDIMKNRQSLVEISEKILKGVDKIIKDVKPDIVLVHGDTSTTLNGALASFYNKVAIGHVEAGLRSFDMYSPFPEEVNRKLTAGLATLHFAPTYKNKENLLREGVDEKDIFITGNTVIDALFDVVSDEFSFSSESIKEIDFNSNKVILLTTHRRENIGKNMENIFKSVLKLIDNNKNLKVIFPIHKNPQIRELANSYFKDNKDNVHIIEPLGYLEFANLMKKVDIIMTDSGGIQEEASSLGKPIIVLRKETERTEAMDSESIILAGLEIDKIYKITNELLNDEKLYKSICKPSNIYGDGNSSDLIVEHIYNYFKFKSN